MYSKEEKKQLVVDFWSGFSSYCFSNKYLNSRKKQWMLHKTKVSNVHFKFDIGRDTTAVVLEVQHRNENHRLDVFQKLEQCKAILEQGFQEGLVWDFLYERETGKEVCRIFTQMHGVDMHRKKDWDKMYEFMAVNMSCFEKNFIEVRDILID